MTTESSPGIPVPFAIRAHHLMNFQYLMYTDWSKRSQPFTPGQVAYLSVESYKRLMAGADSKDKKSLQGAAHAKDTAGSTEEDQAVFRERSRALYETFVSLEANHPVEITVRPDEMCRICIIGNHCTLYKPSPTDSSNALRVDEAVMNMFLRKIEPRRDLRETVRVVDDEVTYEDAGTFPTKRVETIAGTVHEFLKATHPVNFDLGLLGD